MAKKSVVSLDQIYDVSSQQFGLKFDKYSLVVVICWHQTNGDEFGIGVEIDSRCNADGMCKRIAGDVCMPAGDDSSRRGLTCAVIKFHLHWARKSKCAGSNPMKAFENSDRSPVNKSIIKSNRIELRWRLSILCSFVFGYWYKNVIPYN